jgi:histidinol-phosphate aminotransferase
VTQLSAGLRIRPDIAALGRYAPPPPAVRVDGRLARLAANECAYGPLPSVAAAIADAALAANRYPDNECASLRSALADLLGVDAAQVTIGAGSIALLESLLVAVARPDAEIVYPWRSFEAYPTRIVMAGARPVAVPLRDLAVDLPAIADAVTPQTRMVIICNPNNPTGTTVGKGELDAFLDVVPPDCVVAIDEAYHDFVVDGSTDDAVALLRDHPNVAVLRTFSKAHGLAGLRVGYLAAQPALVDVVRQTRLPFAVTQIAQAAARASLRAADELRSRVTEIQGERERMWLAFTRAGFPLPRSAANFLWLPASQRTEEFAALCRAHGVSVMVFSRPDAGIRVTVGEPWENDRVISLAFE